ncbi:Protein turtle B, partial [Ilyodon furcidens]
MLLIIFLLKPDLLLSHTGRARLHGRLSLQIENVRSDDQGWYECKVLMLEQQYDTFHNGSWVHLTVN